MSKVQGIKDRNKALDLALINKQVWSANADNWFARLPRGYEYTADDLVEAIGLPTETGKNGAVGAKIKWWKSKRQAVGLGYTTTSRTSSHARPIMLWEKQ